MIEWALLMIGGWFAATISGAAGFGGALLLLPVLTVVVGAKAAVPILTLAQLLGNASRAGFGFRDIHWRPALAFSAGAVPASIVGARLFIDLPSEVVLRLIGVFLLGVVAYRHTKVGKRTFPVRWLPAAGAVVGFLSAIVGSAGPLGAAVFLSLGLPKVAYVATEAVTATLMHATKTVVYGRYAAIDGRAAVLGLALGGAMVIGSWTGRKIIERLPDRAFSVMVEGLLIVSALVLIRG
jgi:uncharacterized membrane protein YfcA